MEKPLSPKEKDEYKKRVNDLFENIKKRLSYRKQTFTELNDKLKILKADYKTQINKMMENVSKLIKNN